MFALVRLCACAGGSVMFQTEGVVSASECWGAAMHAISQCFFIVFDKSGFGPPKSQCQLSNIITRSQTHTHRYSEKHTHTHTQKKQLLYSFPKQMI